jgi:hypothetical protein
MDLTRTNQRNYRSKPTAPMMRLVLYEGEVYRLPAASQGIRVLAGIAWTTVTGEDVLLRAGEETRFTLGNHIALVSALSRVPLVVEVV